MKYNINLETQARKNKEHSERMKGHIPWNKGIKTGAIPWNKQDPIYKNCLICGIQFQIVKARLHTAKYCSSKCYGKALENRVPWNKGVKQWEGKEHPRGMLGKKFTAEHIEKLKGRTPWNKGKKYKGKPLAIVLRGEKAPNWRGGTTALGLKIRNLEKYKEWRFSAFKRDDFTCQCCHVKSREIEVHHIVSFVTILKAFMLANPGCNKGEEKVMEKAIAFKPFWELRNGITLCKGCHEQTYKRKRKSFSFIASSATLNGGKVDIMLPIIDGLKLYSAYQPGQVLNITIEPSGEEIETID